MQQRQLVSGFSELKDLLIQKYNIKGDRVELRLHFTMSDGELMHNYKRHEQQIVLSKSGSNSPLGTLSRNSSAYSLVKLAVKKRQPDVFLNEQFKLHGFFRF